MLRCKDKVVVVASFQTSSIILSVDNAVNQYNRGRHLGPLDPPSPSSASLCCRRRRHFALSTLTFLFTFCGTLAMAHAAGNSVEAVIDLGAEPSFEVGAWPVASDDDDGRW